MNITWIIKFIRSFSKSSWDLDDYPLCIRHQQNVNPIGRWKPVPWIVQVVNWWQMSGHGNTKEEAYEDLKRTFLKRKQEGKQVPRPGTGLPMRLEFAPSDVIAQYETIARDFLSRIFNLDYEKCLISDQSSLWDFYASESDEPLFQKIRNVYGIDVADIKDGNLVKVFARLASHKAHATKVE